ncbi:hypothetical protein F7725_007074 [Dissostichus mawsoni]|uniref:Ig-like domain-containing protein n=1 Tax=Dissostichus mawsoni TaxID=36200 RepID=A0A7J5XVT3_DISMA|nr:hypothetical protein F7725_007074 [Dissostichus mawsoni]
MASFGMGLCVWPRPCGCITPPAQPALQNFSLIFTNTLTKSGDGEEGEAGRGAERGGEEEEERIRWFGGQVREGRRRDGWGRERWHAANREDGEKFCAACRPLREHRLQEQSLSQECSGGWRAGSSPPVAAGAQLGLVWAEDTQTAASRFKSSIPERISCCKGYFTSSLEPAGFCCSNSFGADLAAMEVQWAGVEVPRMGPQHTAVGLIFSLLLGVWYVQGLEMSVGKIPFLQAVNGSTVLLPCTYLSCIGIKDLYFSWTFNENGTMQKVCDSYIVSEESKPQVNIYRERVEFIGKNIDRNVSILLWNITFDDAGEWTCFGRNPKEKGRNHSTIFTLIVVDECEWSKLVMVVDNTLTIIIASAVGGGIAALMAFMLLKNFTLFVLAKLEEKNKECLVTSSGIDNTENGLSGSKADSKPTPKGNEKVHVYNSI